MFVVDLPRFLPPRHCSEAQTPASHCKTQTNLFLLTQGKKLTIVLKRILQSSAKQLQCEPQYCGIHSAASELEFEREPTSKTIKTSGMLIQITRGIKQGPPPVAWSKTKPSEQCTQPVADTGALAMSTQSYGSENGSYLTPPPPPPPP